MVQLSPMTEVQMLGELRRGAVAVPPLQLKWTLRGGPGGADAVLVAKWGDVEYRFAAELKARSTPRLFAQALAEARVLAERSGDRPLVVVPYLGPERLEQLEGAQVSGLDLCGNAYIVVPGELLIARSGGANRFRESFPIRDVYRGTSSLVARALLLRGKTGSLADLEEFIRSRGGRVTLTTISKVLRRLEDDVLIERRGGRARLLQADALLDKLAGAYRAPKLTAAFVGSTSLTLEQLAARFASTGARVVLTGQSSTGRYAVMGREERLRFYTESNAELLALLDGDVRPGDRFANLELVETSDPTVYFDSRRNGEVAYASPIQTYLELSSGDKREQETAEQVRSLILNELGNVGESK